MKIQKKIKRTFTLIEMLAAMAIFMIISVVMMQFFNSSQQLVTRASQRNQSFANVRVAFELMTRDLQCALYRNGDVASPKAQDIYPFWFQRITTVNDSDYKYSNLLWDSLNFISATDINNEGNSNVCELRYSFVPAGKTFTNPSGDVINEGWLIRSCTNDKDGTKYNFSSNPLKSADATRMNKIWVDTSGGTISEPAQQANASYVKFEKVIPNVYKLAFTCYNKDLNTTGMGAGGSTNVGTPFPTAIKVELDVLSSADWSMWKKLIKANNLTAADELLKKRLRRFSKIIYLPRKETL